jgi:hypothetical protein
MVKQTLLDIAPTPFCPPGSRWITCYNTTFQPHSNECGSRTMLALTVPMSHPSPHKLVLQQYMHPNLSMTSRTWMGACLLSGIAPILLLAPISISNPITQIASSTSFHLIEWYCSTTIRNQANSNQTKSNIPSPAKLPLPPRCIPSHKKQLSNKLSPSTIQTNSKPSKLIPKSSAGKSVRHKQQLTIDTTLWRKRSQYTQFQGVWGHYPEVINEKETLGIILNNPRGFKLGESIQSITYSLGVAEAFGVGVLCIAKANNNWDYKGTRSNYGGWQEPFGRMLLLIHLT